jgi:hypothetical protein
MKKLKKILFIAPLFMLSCASPYLKNYEPILTFLETQKLDKHKIYILQKDKTSNTEPLRLFNGNDGLDHYSSKNLTHDTFHSKHWKKMYNTYANDTIIKYWRKEDFKEYNFTLESSKILYSKAYYENYLNNPESDYEIIKLSEPLYYWNKKYLLFSYDIGYLYSGSNTKVIILKKEKNKYVFYGYLGDYIYN